MTNKSVTSIYTLVTVRGVDMGVQDVTWAASITNDLPGRFTSGDAVEQRTGEIRWKPSELIYDGISPLDPKYPRPGDPVTVQVVVTAEGVTVQRRVFTGVIDVTTGGMGQPLVSRIIDDSDQLNRSVSRYPLVSKLPRRQNTVWPERYPGTAISFVLGEVVKQCEFGVGYPGYGGRFFLRAHLVGSLWTDFLSSEGALIVAGATENGSGEPIFGQIKPSATGPSRIGLLTGVGCWDTTDSTVAATGMWIEAEVHNFDGSSYLYAGCRFNNSTTVQMGVTGGVFYVYTSIQHPVRVTTLSGTHVIGLFYPARVGDKMWARVDDVYYDTGLTRTDPDSTLIPVDGSKSTGPRTAPIFLYKSGTGIVFDLVMGRMPAGSTVDTWKRFTGTRRAGRVNYEVPNFKAGYIPGVEDQSGKAAIDSVSTPFCISSWIDGEGTLNFVSGEQLRARRPILTLNEGDYAPLEWEASYTHAASVVKVKGLTHEVTMTGSGDPVITAWQGTTSDTFDARWKMTEFFTVPEDKDFFEVDTVPTNLNSRFDRWNTLTGESRWTERTQRLWFGWGSAFSVARLSEKARGETGAQDRHIPGSRLFCNVTRLSPRTYLIDYGYKGLWVKESKPMMSPWIASSLGLDATAGDAMPVLRAGGMVTKIRAQTLTKSTGGPPGPELLHDMGIYRGHEGGEYMRDVLARYFSTPHPVFKDVTTVFDPRIDVGQVVTIDASRRWGYTFDCLVTHVEQNPSTGTTSFTPRVITSRRTTTP